MSRIGKLPVVIPGGVTVDYRGSVLTVKGPRGDLTLDVHADMTLEISENRIVVTRPSDGRTHRALHGLTRALIANMVHGVANGYSKTLEIIGVGYRAQKDGKKLVLSLGYSHTIDYPEPDGITLECPRPDVIVVTGIDKQMVGQVAAELRAFRPPEPYKGKGVRYQGEQIRRKVGKTAGS
jgi:large subunit ribosomal protein L6